MSRAVFEALVLFLSPFFLFGIYLFLRRRSPFTREAWDGHVPWLVIAGLAVAIVGFVIAGLTAERNAGAYVPSHLEDGKLVPGHFQ
ncbi:hypothetical protein FHS82_001548 [Pseudochelatococcus lubricantis]|uniref:Uncharacterized protein n=1 Tax=Pseudochelatococcus lubricantis TaxID=1538102 RepID=A0ABX0UXP4_9HYPH|nr:DUF6111 family protein [Pseudochelatococcus lubricantis]NIJ57712.1 hypothetical protein [Pseudochelatococcus lubricantis]